MAETRVIDTKAQSSDRAPRLEHCEDRILRISGMSRISIPEGLEPHRYPNRFAIIPFILKIPESCSAADSCAFEPLVVMIRWCTWSDYWATNRSALPGIYEHRRCPFLA